MAAKRGKSQARRSGGDSGMPGWAWLVLGVALTVGAFFLAPKYLGKGGADGFFRPTPNPDARPPAVDAQSGDNAPLVEDGARDERPADTTGTPPKAQDYDFYSVLSGEEAPLSDAELDRRARAKPTRSVPRPNARNASTARWPSASAASAANATPRRQPSTPTTRMRQTPPPGARQPRRPHRRPPAAAASMPATCCRPVPSARPATRRH